MVDCRVVISDSKLVTLAFKDVLSLERLLRLNTSVCRVVIDDERLEIPALISLISNVVDA